MEEEKSLYSKEFLSEYRKSIKNMGTETNNGTVTIPSTVERYMNKLSDKIDIEELIKTPYTDVKTWRKISRIYYSHPLYRGVIEYFANIFYNQYIISPLFTPGKSINKKKLISDYNALLRSLDEDIKVEEFTTKILGDILLEGAAFYYIEEYSKGASYYYKAIKLPTDYCRLIGTAGTPAVNIFAVDLTFIDNVMSELTKGNMLTREEVLKQYPQALRSAYKAFKEGRNDNKWFVVPAKNGAAFSTRDGMPPFAFLTKEISRIDKFEVLRDDYITTNLTKLLVQLIDIDKEGNPEIDLELAAEFHKNLREIASKKHNVDALTTLAKEIDVLSLGETGDASDNYKFMETFYDQFYNDAGTSSELFNSTSSGTLQESQKKDSMYMYKLREQIGVWFNFYIGAICDKKIVKNSKFVFSFLDTSYKNREEIIGSYLEGAQYGFSKIVAQVALGVKQRYIESLVTFENEILDLNSKLVPLQSSHTMSSKTDNNANSEDANGGRPKLQENEKEDSTIVKDASL